MGGELIAQSCPRGVNLLSQEAGFDRDQQVVSQHAEKDVGLDSILELMENRSLPQRALQIAKGVLNLSQQNVDPPSFFGVKILAVGLEQIGAVEQDGAGFGLGVLLPTQLQ